MHTRTFLVTRGICSLAGLGHQSADFCFGVTYDVDISTNTFKKKAFAPSDAKRYKDMTTKFNVKKRPLYCHPGVLFLRCNDASIRERLTKQQQQQTNNKQTNSIYAEQKLVLF